MNNDHVKTTTSVEVELPIDPIAVRQRLRLAELRHQDAQIYFARAWVDAEDKIHISFFIENGEDV